MLEPLLNYIEYWLSPPDPGSNEEDNIWSDFHIFDGHWIEIQNRLDWYESPHVPRIYKDHKYIFKTNMGMHRPEETYYMQDVDSGEFASTMEIVRDLPSNAGQSAQFKITTEVETKSEPSGENDFCMVEYYVTTEIRYEMPKGITFLPRLVARPLNKFFKWAYLNYMGEEMVDRDGEYAREKTNEYFHYLRKYHGEEPIQTKSRQAEFTPMPEEGVFFQ